MRNFDFFRISHAMEAISLSPGEARKLANEEDGPNLYKTKKPKMPRMTLGRYSEFEAYFEKHSEKLPKKASRSKSVEKEEGK